MIEEIIYRYIIQNWFKKFGTEVSIIASGMVFGLMHYAGGPVLSIIPYSILGLCFAIIYEKTNNIAMTASIHIFNNAFILFSAIVLACFT